MRPAVGIARRAWAAIAAAALVGLALRAFILTHSLGIADSDEAISGLVTRHFLADPTSLPVFVWSTNYAGTLEAVLTAVPRRQRRAPSGSPR
jgi:hypothetical protein